MSEPSCLNVSNAYTIGSVHFGCYLIIKNLWYIWMYYYIIFMDSSLHGNRWTQDWIVDGDFKLISIFYKGKFQCFPQGVFWKLLLYYYGRLEAILFCTSPFSIMFIFSLRSSHTNSCASPGSLIIQCPHMWSFHASVILQTNYYMNESI